MLTARLFVGDGTTTVGAGAGGSRNRSLTMLSGRDCPRNFA
ncbi:hypothetical protein [Streptomyces parvus]